MYHYVNQNYVTIKSRQYHDDDNTEEDEDNLIFIVIIDPWVTAILTIFFF